MPREKSPQQKLVEDVRNRFRQHPGTPQNETIRADFERLAVKLAKTLPPSRETSLVLTKLEEASFFANAAVVRNQEPAASSDAPAEKPQKRAVKRTAKKSTRRPRRPQPPI